MHTTINLGTKDEPLHVLLETLIETRLMVTARSRAGKTWLLRLLIELAAPHIQVIVLDPEGEFSSLRQVAPMLLAGPDGEVPASPKTAKILAHKLFDLRLSAVIDLYELKARDQQEFVRSFCEALISLPKSMYRPVLLVIDEAQMFCPEAKFGNSESTEAVNDVLKRGGKRGLCTVLASLRLAMVSKSAAAQCVNTIIGSTILDTDLVRAGDILGFDKAGRQELRSLEPGQFFAVGPAFEGKGVLRFKSGTPRSKHPKLGDGPRGAVPPTPKALSGVIESLRESLKPEVDQVYDLDAARKTIADLRRQLTKQSHPPAGAANPQELARLNKELRDAGSLLADARRAHESLQRLVAARTSKLFSHLDSARALFAEIPGTTGAAAMATPTVKVPVARPITERTVTDARPVSVERSGDTSLSKSEAAFLSVLASYPDGRTKRQLGIQAGYSSNSGSFRNTLSSLKTRGFITRDGDNVIPTSAGIEAAGGLLPLPTGGELVDHWLSQLEKAPAEILRVLVDAYPNALSKEEVGAKSGYQASSGSFRNALSRLRTLELITGYGNEPLRASEEFFS